jgi:hypothetical protein
MVQMSRYQKLTDHIIGSSSRRSALIATLIAVVTVGAGAALAMSGPATPRGLVPPVAKTTLATAVEPAARTSFSLLRRAQGADDAIPASTPVALSQSSGANVALARRVKGDHGAEAWLIPGTGSLCLLAQLAADHIGGAACTTRAATSAGELVLQSASSHLPGAELVAGVVPDGVSSIMVNIANQPGITVPVHENVYLVLVHGAATSLRAIGPAGPIQIDTSATSTSSRVIPTG